MRKKVKIERQEIEFEPDLSGYNQSFEVSDEYLKLEFFLFKIPFQNGVIRVEKLLRKYRVLR